MATDFSAYLSWPKVVGPSGQVFYEVPGTGYLYDPFLSEAKGRPVIFPDPRPQIAEAQKQKDAAEKAQKQDQFNRSPAGQAIPVVGGVAGTVGAAYLINEINKAPLPSVSPTPPTTPTLNAPAPQLPSAPPPSLSQAAAEGSLSTGGSSVQIIQPGQIQPPGTTAIGSTAEGGIMVAPTDSIAPDGTLSQSTSFDVNQAVQGLQGGAQLYSAYTAYKSGDKLGAGIYGSAGAANVATALSADLGANVVPGLNAAAGLYQGYQTAKYLSDAPNGGKRNAMGTIGGATAGAADTPLDLEVWSVAARADAASRSVMWTEVLGLTSSRRRPLSGERATLN
jgi:hypothetical protein